MRPFFLFLLFIQLVALGAEKFFCPMHCEKEKTYEKAGTCPVCHMYLEKEPEPGAETGPLSSKDYRVDVESKVTKAFPRHEMEITITPRSTRSNSVITDLENANGLELEVYVTNQDLNYMKYAIPRKNQNGSFSFTQEFYRPENALLFAIFRPTGMPTQTFPIALKVATDKTFVRPEAHPKRPTAKKTTEGGFGYIVVASEDTTYFLREHMSMEKITKNKWKEQILKKLPKPGRYSAFIQEPHSADLAYHLLRKK